MAYTQLTINDGQSLSITPSRGRAALRKVANRLQAMLSGTAKSGHWSLLNLEASGIAQRACGAATLSSASGAVGVVINGTTVTDTAAGGDTATAALIVTAVNADATTAALGVKATKYVGVITLASSAAGDTINVCGQRFVAGTDFSIAGTDAQDAAALAVAMRANPYLSSKFAISSAVSAAVVYIGTLSAAAAESNDVITVEAGTGITATAQITTGARLMCFAQVPGAIGNACTFTATGTGVTIHPGSKMAGGLNAAPTNFITSASK